MSLCLAQKTSSIGRFQANGPVCNESLPYPQKRPHPLLCRNRKTTTKSQSHGERLVGERCLLEKFVNSLIRMLLESRICQVWEELTLVHHRSGELLEPRPAGFQRVAGQACRAFGAWRAQPARVPTGCFIVHSLRPPLRGDHRKLDRRIKPFLRACVCAPERRISCRSHHSLSASATVRS